MLEELVGTHGAAILDEKLNLLGKVPLAELGTTVRSLGSGMHAIILDGAVDKELVSVAERSNVRFIIGKESQVNPAEARMTILTSAELQ